MTYETSSANVCAYLLASVRLKSRNSSGSFALEEVKRNPDSPGFIYVVRDPGGYAAKFVEKFNNDEAVNVRSFITAQNLLRTKRIELEQKSKPLTPEFWKA